MGNQQTRLVDTERYAADLEQARGDGMIGGKFEAIGTVVARPRRLL